MISNKQSGKVHTLPLTPVTSAAEHISLYNIFYILCVKFVNFMSNPCLRPSRLFHCCLAFHSSIETWMPRFGPGHGAPTSGYRVDAAWRWKITVDKTLRAELRRTVRREDDGAPRASRRARAGGIPRSTRTVRSWPGHACSGGLVRLLQVFAPSLNGWNRRDG